MKLSQAHDDAFEAKREEVTGGPRGGRLTGYRSPGRRAERRKVAKAALAIAKNCPDIFAEDAEFMRLFRESKRLEGLKGQRAKLAEVMNKLRARGWFLEKQAAAYG